MDKSKRGFAPGPITLFFAVVLAALVGSLLHDARGVPFGYLGGILWGGALLASFILTILYVGRRVTAYESTSGWSDAVRLIGSAFLSRAATQPHTPIQADPSGLYVPPSFKTLGAGVLPSHEAAAIVRGGRFARAAGPGLVMLSQGETVSQVIDLRPQVRREAVSAFTRDGIAVDTHVSVVFQVRRPPDAGENDEPVDPIPYPYEPNAIFQLNYATTLAEGLEVQPWTEQVCPQAVTLLVSELGRYSIDELLAEGSVPAMTRIKANVMAGLQDQQGEGQLQSITRGIEIISVGVGALELPEDVQAKQISSWQVEWQTRTAQALAAGRLEAERVHQRARARAQVEGIENLLVSIEAMRSESEAQLHEVVMMRLVEVLEAARTNKALEGSAARPLMLSVASEASAELRSALDNEQEEA